MNRIYTSLIVIIAVVAAWLGSRFWSDTGADVESPAPTLEQATPAQPGEPVTQEPSPAPPAASPESGSSKKFNF